jgi:hypothetical protein
MLVYKDDICDVIIYILLLSIYMQYTSIHIEREGERERERETEREKERERNRERE